MTCTAAGFELLPHKRNCGQTLAPESENHCIAFLMCGTQKKFRSLAFDNCACRQPCISAILRPENNEVKDKGFQIGVKCQRDHSQLISAGRGNPGAGTFFQRAGSRRHEDNSVGRDSSAIYWSISNTRITGREDAIEDDKANRQLFSAEHLEGRCSPLVEGSRLAKKRIGLEIDADWPSLKRRKLDNKSQVGRNVHNNGSCRSPATTENLRLHLANKQQATDEMSPASSDLNAELPPKLDMGYHPCAGFHNADSVDKIEVDNHELLQSRNSEEISQNGLNRFSVNIIDTGVSVNQSLDVGTSNTAESNQELSSDVSVNRTVLHEALDRLCSGYRNTKIGSKPLDRLCSKYRNTKMGGKSLDLLCSRYRNTTLESESLTVSNKGQSFWTSSQDKAQVNDKDKHIKAKDKPGQDHQVFENIGSRVADLSLKGFEKLESSDKFLLVVDSRMRVLYISGNASRLLGHRQGLMLGQNIVDYIHPSSVQELKRHLNRHMLKTTTERDDCDEVWNTSRTIFVGMRVKLQDSSEYFGADACCKKVQWKILPQLRKSGAVARIVGLCTSISIPDSFIRNSLFRTHNMRLQFMLFDPRVIDLIGSKANDLIGQIICCFHGVQEAVMCKLCFQKLILRQGVRSCCYRVLSNLCRWLRNWSQAGLAYAANGQPQCSVCKDYTERNGKINGKLSKPRKGLRKRKCPSFDLQTDAPDHFTDSSHQVSTGNKTGVILEQFFHALPAHFEAKISSELKTTASIIHSSQQTTESIPRQEQQQAKSLGPFYDSRTVINDLQASMSKSNVSTPKIKSAEETEECQFQNLNSVSASSKVNALCNNTGHETTDHDSTGHNNSIRHGNYIGHYNSEDYKNTGHHKNTNHCNNTSYCNNTGYCNNTSHRNSTGYCTNRDHCNNTGYHANTGHCNNTGHPNDIDHHKTTGHCNNTGCCKNTDDTTISHCKNAGHHNNADSIQTKEVSRLECHSLSESQLPTNYSSECFNGTSKISVTVNHLELPDAFPVWLKPETDDAGIIYEPELKNTRKSVDNESAEHDVKGKSKSDIQKYEQGIQPGQYLNLSDIHSSVLSLQGPNYSFVNEKKLTNLDSSHCPEKAQNFLQEKSLPFTSKTYQSKFQHGCHQEENASSNLSETRAMSKIAMLLQMKNMPNWLVRPNTVTAFAENDFKTTNNTKDEMEEKVTKTTTRQSNEVDSSVEEHNSELCNKSKRLKNRLLSSPNSEVHAYLSSNIESPAVISPLTSHLLLSHLHNPPLCHKNQSDVTSGFSHININSQCQSTVMESTILTGCDFENTARNMSSIITNKKSDPYFSELSDEETISQSFRDTVMTSTIITNKKSDPFLSKLSDQEMISQSVRNTMMTSESDKDTMMTSESDRGTMNDLLFRSTVNDLSSEMYTGTSSHQELSLSLDSSFGPVTSPQERQSFLEQFDDSHSSHSHNLSDTSSNMADLSLNELESFLHDIPSTSPLETHFNEMDVMQAATFTKHSKFCQFFLSPEPTSESTDGLCKESGLNEDDDEISTQPPCLAESDPKDVNGTQTRPSLLRTLLDKEGATIQGPLTYTEWLLEKTLQKKQEEVKKPRLSHFTANFSHVGNKIMRKRRKKNIVTKSTELPLPRCPRRHLMNQGRIFLQPKKPTKELPLPSPAIQSYIFPPKNNTTGDEIFHQNKNVDKENVKALDINSSAEDLRLPDDFLDLAVEYCASLGADQTEALISDFTDSCSWEDSLYSLVGSPAEETKSTHSSSSADSELQPEMQYQDQDMTESLGPLINSSVSESCTTSNSIDTFTDIHKSHTHSPSTPAQFSTKMVREPPQITIKIGNQVKFPAGCFESPSPVINRMSLLRAAVTSPDVDKLIKQIPLGCLNRLQPSQQQDTRTEDDPDVIITKVSGLTKTPTSPSDRIPETIVINAAASNPGRYSNQPSISPPRSGCGSPRNDAGHIQDLFDHFCMVSLSSSPANNIQQAQSPLTTMDPPKKTIRKLTSNNPTLKIKINPLASSKIIKKTSKSNAHLKSRFVTHQSISTDEINPQSKQVTVSTSELSTTQPVSVMIMRKMNHRSRRLKNIAVQTENEPGEVYPDFEHSPTDTILYPSVIYSPPPSNTTSRNFTSSPSQCLSSSPSLPILPVTEKLLQGFSVSDDSSSSIDKDYCSKSNTPFLQKLLMGELSRDQYQRLDQQLLERERHIAAS